MKKIITILMVLIVLISFTGCSNESDEETKTNDSDIVETQDSAIQEDIDKLSEIGEVEVKDGILYVSINLPSSFVSGVTQEDLDNDAGASYVDAKLNDDGSVTMKLTKDQYEQMLQDIADELDDSINQLKEDGDYTISDIKHNEDYTVFDVTVSGSELGIYDSFSVIALYFYGGMYNIFAGKDVDKIVVNFYDPSGNLISSSDSSETSN